MKIKLDECKTQLKFLIFFILLSSIEHERQMLLNTRKTWHQILINYIHFIVCH